MSENCNQHCAGCDVENCSSRQGSPVDKSAFLAPANAESKIKKVFGIVSGKGGVGKSLVTALLAVALRRAGQSTAILDGDITGPSIPRMFGLHDIPGGEGETFFPAESELGIKVLSTNLLLDEETQPIVWRGPVIAEAIKQFWTNTRWGDIDALLVDMPPGTGDVPLTVFQSLPVDGIIIVTSPQELVSMIVAKAVRMAQMMQVPILGIVENMSYFTAPDTGKRYAVFGESHVEEIARRSDLAVLAKLPLDPTIAAACDAGRVETVDTVALGNAAAVLQAVIAGAGD